MNPVHHWDDATRRRVAILVLLSVAAFVLSLVVQLVVLPLRSGNSDEAVYIFQAQMLLDGIVTLPAAEYGTFFRPWLSGEIDDRIFTEYQVGFPLFLAASDLLLGSMRVGLALVAGATVPATFVFTRRLLGDERTARWAAGLVALSPMTILLSGLFVTYSLTVLVLLVAGWGLLAAADSASWWPAAVAGLATGVGLLVRPYDVVWFVLPLAVLTLMRLRASGHLRGPVVARLAAIAAAGVVPAIVITLLYNWRTTGAPLSFPNMAADELNTFGFGDRRLVESEPIVDYHVRDALRALWHNVRAVPSWLPGGALLLALAGVGAFVDGGSSGRGGGDRGSSGDEGGRRGHLAERLTLVAVVVAFPFGYFFWWATVLSAEGAVNGIGPHYYVPSLAALCLLGARGLVWLVPARRVPVLAVVVLLAAFTAWALPDKFEDKRINTLRARNMIEAVPADLTDAIVLVEQPRPYTMSDYPVLSNRPGLDDGVLFGIDRGVRNIELLERFPDRALFHLRAEITPGGDLVVPDGVLQPMAVMTGERIRFTLEPRELPLARPTRAVLEVGEERHVVDLGDDATAAGPVTFELSRAGVPGAGEGDRIPLEESAEVRVGFESDLGDGSDELEWFQQRWSVVVGDDELTLIGPGRDWARVVLPTAVIERRWNTSEQLGVTVEVEP